jgi:hypothetical protein
MQQEEGIILAGYLGTNYDVFSLTGLRYLDGDADVLDVAILHAPEADYLSFTDKRFFRIPTWPIPKAQVGEPVFVVGYAGFDREVIPLDSDLEGTIFRRGLVLGYSHFAFHVSSVSDRHFVLANEKGERVYALKNPRAPDAVPLAGMSGSPGFVVREGVEYLVGFLYEGTTSLNSFFLTHAYFLRPDGTLDHSLIPL